MDYAEISKVLTQIKIQTNCILDYINKSGLELESFGFTNEDMKFNETKVKQEIKDLKYFIDKLKRF